MKKIKYFIFSIICLFSCSIVFADNEVIIKSITPVYDKESSIVVTNENKNHSVTFNEKDQVVKYNVVIENTSGYELKVDGIDLSTPSEDFIVYEVKGIEKNDVLKSTETKELVVTIKATAVNNLGKDFNEDLLATINFEKSVTNPFTSTKGLIVILVFATCVAGVSIILYRKNKLGSYVTIIILCFSVTSMVRAQNITNLVLKFNVVFESNIVSKDFDFGWIAGNIDEKGITSTNIGTGSKLNNYYTPIMYFGELTLNLLSDDVMFKIVEYDETGNFISSGEWQSKSKTNWSSGGVSKISVKDKYIRIAIADTTLNNSGSYNLTSSDFNSRYSYEILKKTTNSNNPKEDIEDLDKVNNNDFDFCWKPGTINNNTGNIETGSSYLLNNYYTPIFYFYDLTLNLSSDNVMFKIVEYDKNGNFLSSGVWQSKSETNWSDGGTTQISIKDKYVRIAIADTTLNHSGSYNLTSSDYNTRYNYENVLPSYQILTSKETIQLPDIKYGEENSGFTITGLAYSTSDNTYYAGNYGKVHTSDSITRNTIVHLSSDLKQNLGEIELNTIYPNLYEVQGVTVDSSDNTLWFVSQSKVYHISKSGEDLGVFSISSGNLTGIAYDSRTDSLWILCQTGIKNISKNGSIKLAIDLDISHSDQIFLDENNNSIYITAGADYDGDSYVYKVSLSTQKYILMYVLKDSYAIEGIYINDNKMYIGNDGIYHNAAIKKNIIQVYFL